MSIAWPIAHVLMCKTYVFGSILAYKTKHFVVSALSSDCMSVGRSFTSKFSRGRQIPASAVVRAVSGESGHGAPTFGGCLPNL